MSGWTENDLEPPLSGTVTGKVRADHPDLTDAQFIALPPAPVSLADATAATAHVRRADLTVISRDVVLGDQVTAPGTWSMAWVVGDLSCSGTYTGEVEVMWPGIRPQTFGPASFPVAREIA